jgi:hypothetical protein
VNARWIAEERIPVEVNIVFEALGDARKAPNVTLLPRRKFQRFIVQCKKRFRACSRWRGYMALKHQCFRAFYGKWNLRAGHAQDCCRNHISDDAQQAELVIRTRTNRVPEKMHPVSGKKARFPPAIPFC